MKQLLAQAREEILVQRRELEILRAKVEMVDLFACVFNTQPAHVSMGMGEDVAWKLQQKIDELSKRDDTEAFDGGRLG